MKLNTKQQIVGWLMLLLISELILCAILTIPPEQPIYTKVFLSFYFPIVIIGIPIVYALRDKKK
jgi:hypothetical protein